MPNRRLKVALRQAQGERSTPVRGELRLCRESDGIGPVQPRSLPLPQPASVPAKPVLLFDARCNLCNGFARFAAARDRSCRLDLVPIETQRGQELLRQAGLPKGDARTVVLLEGERRFTRSSAALRVATRLGWPWRLLYGLIAVPAPVRDGVYAFVAANRYRWWGRAASREVPQHLR